MNFALNSQKKTQSAFINNKFDEELIEINKDGNNLIGMNIQDQI